MLASRLANALVAGNRRQPFNAIGTADARREGSLVVLLVAQQIGG